MEPNDHTVEIQSILSLSEEIIHSAARKHPSNLRPKLGAFPPGEYDNVQRESIGVNFSIPLSFDDGSEWVVKFPLNSRTSCKLMERKVLSEVATMNWVRQNTKIPVPAVHASDAVGTAEWNTTCRPCIIVDRIKGHNIGNEEWLKLKKPQQLRVLIQIAEVVAELGAKQFDRIGSLYESSPGNFFVGPLADLQCNEFCMNGAHSDLFLAQQSPYRTVMEYCLDMANMRLLFESLNKPAVTERFAAMWLFRSLLPALVINDFDHGPFVLRHGNLRRSVVFFDEGYTLTGVNNWEWSKTIPIQSATVHPPFTEVFPFTTITPDNARWFLKLHDRFQTLLKGREIKQAELTGQQALVQTELREKAKPFLTIEYILSSGLLHLDTSFWSTVFEPMFGNVDRQQFMGLYFTAPGVVAEFQRIQAFIKHYVYNTLVFWSKLPALRCNSVGKRWWTVKGMVRAQAIDVWERSDTIFKIINAISSVLRRSYRN